MLDAYSYQVIESKRKSLGISIKLDGSVTVRVPLKTPKYKVEQFLNKYQGWINTKLTKINLARKKQAQSNLFYWLGEQYPLKETALGTEIICFNGKEFLVQSNFTHQISIFLAKWYSCQAKQLIEPIIENYAKIFKLKYVSVRITSAKNRWGSCSSNGRICFSYRIAMLPIEVIKYIVAHELAHLVHLDHSLDFWQYVEQLYPDYKLAHKWLKEQKYILAASIL